MVFNILMDNTDDHERNHSLRLGFDGYYDLSPAYDVVPSLQNLGYQAMLGGHVRGGIQPGQCADGTERIRHRASARHRR